MITLSSSEMLALWRRHLGLSPSRRDCSVEIVEGIDVDDIIAQRIRSWYLDLLDNAPPCLLPTRDYSPDVRMTLSLDSPWGEIALPPQARRPLSVCLKGWVTDAPVLSPAQAAPRIARMASPFGMPGPCEPLAIRGPDGIVRVTPLAGPVSSLIAVDDPSPDAYTLDPSLLPFPRNL